VVTKYFEYSLSSFHHVQLIAEEWNSLSSFHQVQFMAEEWNLDFAHSVRDHEGLLVVNLLGYSGFGDLNVRNASHIPSLP
jgi:hypothetical protein